VRISPLTALIKSVIICHEDSVFDSETLSRWLASFSELKGIVLLREKSDRKFKRIKREIKRSGPIRFLDVAAFRLYYKFRSAQGDTVWERELVDKLNKRYPAIEGVPVLVTNSPNSVEAEEFIRQADADIILARCKVILNRRIFSLAKTGTFVMHPGICPEYRNAHGCFWALASGDEENVGMTLLKIDDGVDTGPIFGYYSYDFDSLNESHFRIQTRVVSENLDEVAAKLQEIATGKAETLSPNGRKSGSWGHPWLTKYMAWKRRAARASK